MRKRSTQFDVTLVLQLYCRGCEENSFYYVERLESDESDVGRKHAVPVVISVPAYMIYVYYIRIYVHIHGSTVFTRII